MKAKLLGSGHFWSDLAMTPMHHYGATKGYFFLVFNVLSTYISHENCQFFFERHKDRSDHFTPCTCVWDNTWEFKL